MKTMTSKESSSPLQVGVIDFINSYPLFYPLRFQKVPTNAQFHTGTPKEINALLETGKVDTALISSVSYIENRSQYILLSDYGIGAREKVMSVGLFCTQPKFSFKEATSFLIPKYSMTSTNLLKALTSCYWKSNATFTETLSSEEALFQQEKPFLLIGDACLKNRYRRGSFLDLATAWNEATGMSFVFALVATRNDAFLKKRKEVLLFHKDLIQSYSWSKEHESEIIHVCSERANISADLTKEYFRTLDYELVQEHINGLDHFSTIRVS